MTKRQTPRLHGANEINGSVRHEMAIDRAMANQFDEPSAANNEWQEPLQCIMAELLEGGIQDSEIVFKAAYQSDPSNLIAGFLLAQHYRIQQKYEKMIEIFEKFAEQAPLPSIFSYELAAGYLKLGAIDAAIPLLERLTRQFGHGEFPIAELAECYLKKGRLMEAIKLVNSALEKHPASPRLHNLLAQMTDLPAP